MNKTIGSDEKFFSSLSLVKKAIQHNTINSNAELYSALNTIVEIITENPKLSDNCKRYYIELCELLTSKYCTEWIQKSPEGFSLHDSFTKLFLLGPAEESLTVIYSTLSSERINDKQLRFIALLETWFKHARLSELFRSTCIVDTESARSNSAQLHPVVSILSSIPDIVIPKAHLHESCNFFVPDKYVRYICGELAAAFDYISDRLRQNTSSSVAFIAAVIGKFCIVGYGQLMWTHFLERYAPLIEQDFLLQRIWKQIFLHIPDNWLEAAVMPLLCSAATVNIAYCFLGANILERSKLSYLFTHKLLLIRCFQSHRTAQNALGMLCHSSTLFPLFHTSIENLLKVWSDGSALKRRPVEQTIYIAKCIAICIGYCKRDPKLLSDDIRNLFRKHLLSGLINYLESTDATVRRTGCFLGEQISFIVSVKDGEKLDFNMGEHDDTVVVLRDIIDQQTICTDPVSGPRKDSVQSPPVTDSIENENGKNPQPQEKNRSDKNDTPRSDNGFSRSATNELDSDDEEDELVPLAMNPHSTRHPKRPKYLAQCIDGFVQHEDVELQEQCLQHAEDLIRSNTQSSELSVELAKVVLHLEDRFNLPDYNRLRHGILVASLVTSPASVAEYFCRCFYERNYNISQRLDILMSLSSAAQELSSVHNEIKPDSNSTNLPLGTISSDTLSLDYGTDSPTAIIMKRLEAKTRRFHKPIAHKPVETANRFAPVAGHFFYPLMLEFDNRRAESHLDLLDRDHLLLQKLLHTLATVLYCSVNTPNVINMAKSLLQFTWSLRRHPRETIRCGVLFSMCMILVSIPSFMLVGDLSEEMLDVKNWLEDEVLLNDPNSECRGLATQCLSLMHASLNSDKNLN